VTETESSARSISHEGVRWRVEIVGHGVSGTGRFADRGIQLLRFTRENAPDEPVREIVTALFDLDLAHDREILELLQLARPPAEPRQPTDSRFDADEPAPDEAPPDETA